MYLRHSTIRKDGKSHVYWRLVRSVRLDRVRLERGLRFGDVWQGWTLWRALQVDEGFAQLIPPGRGEVSWPVMAAVLVLARLSEPSSELHVAEHWYRKTALEDLLGLSPDKVNEDRLHRALDQILPHKGAVEQHIRARLGEHRANGRGTGPLHDGLARLIRVL